MAKAPRKSPGIGDNSKPIDQAAVRKALAMSILADKQKTDLNIRIKRMRSGFEKEGVPLAELDRLFKMRDEPASEILRMFRTLGQVFFAFFTDLGDQFDLLAPKADAPEERAAYRHAGMMQALKGEKMNPVPGLSGDSLQQMIEGYNEAWPLYEAGQADFADFLREALENAEAGIVTDGTGKKTAAERKAASVAAKAAKDFAEDNGDPLVVNGVAYPNMTAADQARQKLKDKAAGDGVKTADDFEASPEELAAQTQRKVLEEQRAAGEQPEPEAGAAPPATEPDAMDEASLAEAEAKLKASGFAAQKPKRRGK
jgi:hypothetical protein